MSNLEEIKLAICSSLPGLSDETHQKIHGLTAIGVETKSYLPLVKDEDLMEHLQCHQLLNAWKCEGISISIFAFQVDRKIA